MENLYVFDCNGNKILTESFNLSLDNINIFAIHKSIKVYMANKRSMNAKTKNRNEIRGGGKKPWRQKGTGRARAGSIRSPIWVGGGIVFGPTGKQNFKLKQNSKENFLALQSVFILKAKDKKIIILDKIISKKTKEIIQILKIFKIDNKKNLIIINKRDKELYLSTRNIENVKLLHVNNINIYDILNAEYILLTIDSFKIINNRFIIKK